MYPFSTNHRKIMTPLNPEEVRTIISKYVKKRVIFEFSDQEVFYGSVSRESAKFVLGTYRFRNNFLPVVVMRWKQKGNFTELRSYLRLDRIILSFFIFFNCFGLMLFRISGFVIPLIFTAFLTVVMLFGIFPVFYYFTKKRAMKSWMRFIQN